METIDQPLRSETDTDTEVIHDSTLCTLFCVEALRTHIIKHLANKVLVSMMKLVAASAATNLVKSSFTLEREKEEERTHDVTPDEIYFAMNQQF